jgi:hypothetical protein
MMLYTSPVAIIIHCNSMPVSAFPQNNLVKRPCPVEK